jgi:prepilin-type N-terminal cleavage/methylation domain-containing protein
MKTTNSDRWPVAGLRQTSARQTGDKMGCATREAHPRHVSPVTCHSPAFTLIELLVVIGIIAVLASLLLAVVGAAERKAMIQTTQAQLAQLETAIDRYKSAYGFYPPDSTNTIYNTPINQLYYELVGTTNVIPSPGTPLYHSLDNASQPLTGAQVKSAFGVSGFMNCSKSGTDESSKPATDFLPDLRPNQMVQNYTNNNVPLTLLVASAGGPDLAYKPLGVQDMNPWRYNSSSPANNPGSYDLWMQLDISGTTNLICNWSKQPQLNSPLP